MKTSVVPLLCLAVSASLFAVATRAEDKPPPLPTGPQSDGPFRKVILESDREINGKFEDTLKDPMELAVAADGRVFYAQRDGIVKVWKPDTKISTVLGKLEVFGGLEDGLLGITLDPRFLKNGWIYLNHSLPETGKDRNGEKAGTNRISRFTVTGDTLDLIKAVIDVFPDEFAKGSGHGSGGMPMPGMDMKKSGGRKTAAKKRTTRK